MKRLVLLLMLLASPAFGQAFSAPQQSQRQLFHWSPANKPYFSAACVVKSSDGKCGSGVYCEYDGMVGVLTCKHVAGGESMTCTFNDGQSLRGKYRTDKLGHDIAWVSVKHPTITPLKISDVGPQQGERVEFVSRGGPLSQLRHWYGTVESDGERLNVNANITPGDSGGTILNAGGEIVGVSTDGRTTATKVNGWVVYAGAGSPGWTPIRNFVRRVREAIGTQCPDCPPQPRGNYGDLYPPDYGRAPPPPPPQYDKPQPSPIQPGDLDGVIAAFDRLMEKMEPIPGPPGPPGKDGCDGKDGKSPSADDVAKALQPSLPTAESIADVLYVKYGDQLTARVKAQIPPLYVEVIDPTGKYSAPPQAIHFMEGEGLRLVLDPTQLVLPKAD